MDLKDRKILYELELNGRMPESTIAKRVGVSKEVVHYRLKKLQNQGIIKSFNTIIETWNLGFLMHRTYFKFTNINKEKEEEVIKYITNKINWIAIAKGKWDIGTMILTQDVYEYHDFIKDLKLKFGDYIDDYRMSFVAKLWHFKRGFLLPKVKNDFHHIIKQKTRKEVVKVDKIDVKILNLIATNARLKYTEIAKRVGVNEKLIRDRIRRLEKEEVILGYTTVLDHVKLGLVHYKVHFKIKNYSEEGLKKLHRYALVHPHIVYTLDSIEDMHFEIEIQVKTSAEFYEIINDIRTKFPQLISDYYFLEYIDEPKYHYLPKKITVKV